MEEIKTESAPDWAMFLAQDGDGVWYWHANKPKPNGATVCGEGYWISTGESCIACRGELIGDWRDTLERRPDMYKSEPKIDTSAEHVQKTAESMRDWFERGELPPVGMAVQLWHGGTYAYDCELIAKRGNNFVLWNLTRDRPDSADCMMCEFKPIPTERDVLIEMLADMDGSPATAGKVADAILAAGFSLGAK